MSFLPHWVNWNFTGYEGKEDWKEIEGLYSSLEKLPPGRIMWEPNADLNRYIPGTMRTGELPFDQQNVQHINEKSIDFVFTNEGVYSLRNILSYHRRSLDTLRSLSRYKFYLDQPRFNNK